MSILHELLKLGYTPSDRIFSATSIDGSIWSREKGIRLEKSKNNPADSSFYCFVHQPEDLNGSYEMFFHTSTLKDGKWKTNIVRSISTNGVDWDQKPELILENRPDEINLTQIRAPYLKNFNGFWRLYFSAKNPEGITKIFSAKSYNRNDWEIEPGYRIGPELFPEMDRETIDGVSDTSIMDLPDGSLRMLFSVYRDEVWKQNICSAISTDGLNWIVEPGIRINFGSKGCRFVVNNPSVIHIDGRWNMFFRGSNNIPIKDKIFRAESDDGLNWHISGTVLAPNPECLKERHEVAHPFVFQTTEGLYRMYYTGCCGTIFDSFSYRYYENIYQDKGIEIIYD